MAANWKDKFNQLLPVAPARDAFTVSPHDTNALSSPVRALYIGTSGDVKIKTLAGTSITFTAVPVGVLPVCATQVFSTGTTASNIIGLL